MFHPKATQLYLSSICKIHYIFESSDHHSKTIFFLNIMKNTQDVPGPYLVASTCVLFVEVPVWHCVGTPLGIHWYVTRQSGWPSVSHLEASRGPSDVLTIKRLGYKQMLTQGIEDL